MRRRYVARRRPPSFCATCARGLYGFALLKCPRGCGVHVCRNVDRCLDTHLKSCGSRTFTDSPGAAA